jgi:hypothetical protein
MTDNADFTRGFVTEGFRVSEGGDPTPLPARLGTPWNGFADPYFDRATTDRVVNEQQALLDRLSPEQQVDLYSLAWDGDAILVHIPRPRPALTPLEEEAPSRIEAIDIDGEPHWNLRLGWCWEQVNEDGEGVSNETTAAQRDAYLAVVERLVTVRETLGLETRLRIRRLEDGSDVFPVFASLGEYEDREPTRLQVRQWIGNVTIAPDGTTTLELKLDHRFPQQPATD